MTPPEGLGAVGVVERGLDVVPGYPAVALLSRGRDLDVYDAWDQGRGCRCVVKTLRPDRLDDRGASRRLLLEGRLLRRLAHPHVVRAYDLVSSPRPAVVLETLTGVTLAALLDDRGRLPVRDTAVLGMHLASALAYLHGQGWLHLDIKPSNIVAEGGRAKLIDLSVARRPGRPRTARGTRGYMAPEHVDGSPVGPAADVWSLGAVLFEALTGEGAVEDDETTTGSGSDSGTGSGDRPARVPVGRLRRLPRELSSLVEGCLHDDPQVRPLLAEVTDVLADVAGVDLRAPAPGHVVRWSRGSSGSDGR